MALTRLGGDGVARQVYRVVTAFTHPAPSTTTFADVTGFAVTLAPDTAWHFHAVLHVEGAEAADVKYQWTGPVGGSVSFVSTGLSSAASSDGGATRTVSRSGFTQPTGNFGLLAAAAQPTVIQGVLTCGSTAGVAQLQSGQGTANATAHVIQVRSFLVAEQI